MNAEKINLNLTRKWRSKNFDQIVGQDLSVRMLKNSLYLRQFFPVYLFAGQRGCGKTSTARVFASAINCSNIANFQKNPRKHSVPCLACDSCKAMKTYSHPDFIEIDAASHTGVDNVRQIIESSSFMPLMGSKRIYLIDEAHMLSKAAFNAFLKILEEPPASVIFILATTSPQKIIETVRSRCFQIFFKPVEHASLIEHLTYICGQEQIPHDQGGLKIITNESQGSVRDALNILEQVRFSSGSITKKTVQDVLGHIDDERLLRLFECLTKKGPKEVLIYLKDLNIESFSAEYLWKKIIEIARAAVWLKHGVAPSWYVTHGEDIKKIIARFSWSQLNYIMQLFYENEAVFIKTMEKHSLLEMILLQIAKKNNVSDKSGASSAPQKVSPAPVEQEAEYVIIQEEEEVEYEEDQDEDEDSQECSKAQVKTAVSVDLSSEREKKKEYVNNWNDFLVALDHLNDPLLCSIFKNGENVNFDTHSGDLEVTFLKRFSFFSDSLQETKELWMPLLQNVYGKNVNFKPLFTKEGPDHVKKAENIVCTDTKNESRNLTEIKKKVAPSAANNNVKSYRPAFSRFNKNNSVRNIGKLVDVSDVVAWKKANILLKYFSGNITEIQESK